MQWPPLDGRWHIFLLSISAACFSGLSFAWHITNSIPSLSCVNASKVKRKSNDHLHFLSMSPASSSSSSFPFINLIMRRQWNEWMAGSSQKKKKNETPGLHLLQMFHYFTFLISQRQRLSVIFFFFKVLRWCYSENWLWSSIAARLLAAINRSIEEFCRALKYMFVQLKVNVDHCYLYLSSWTQWKRKARWDWKCFYFFLANGCSAMNKLDNE